MQEQINNLSDEIKNLPIHTLADLEAFRLNYLSKKGKINQLFAQFKQLPPEKKQQFGQSINTLKTQAQEKYNSLKSTFASERHHTSSGDLTRPGLPDKIGTRHPISTVRNEIIEIFKYLGFTVSTGPEIENDWHVFTALNFPEAHPARDMQDTFFIDEFQNILLRTHTSSVQIRVMENTQPPIRTISPGRVFRNESVSARAHCIFHQIEGLFIDTAVSFADLKQTLYFFAQEMFSRHTKIRLRPSYSPFTEPSAEMDISCQICGGSGCNVCKYSGWLEILGCGMVDPNVLDNCSINSGLYTGFAFGMGIERIVMSKYQVNDLRLYFENDTRFLSQFHASF